MNLAPSRRKRRPGATVAEAGETRGFFKVHTGLSVNLELLEPDDQDELVGLADKLHTTNGLDWGRLSPDERLRCEALIERAAGHEPGTFTQAREDAKSFREFAKIAADSRRRETLTRRGERDFFAAMHAQLKSGHFWIGHVSVLVLAVSRAPGRPCDRADRVDRGGRGKRGARVRPRLGSRRRRD